ncbi:Gfo/Idh/MocA family protein [Fulvitalea axinellae]
MIRLGVIGTGKITGRLLEAVKESEGIEAVAVYSRTEEKGRAFADEYDIPKVFTSLEAFGQSREIDAVYVASPNAMHAQQAEAMMRAGKHVLCEKPFASNTKEVRSMIQTAKECGVTLMEAMMTTHTPNFEAIRQNLPRLGKIRRFSANFCQYSSRYDSHKAGQYTNTFDPTLSNGSLVDIGVYCVAPCVHLFGQPESVYAQAQMLSTGVDGMGTVCLRYDGFEAVLTHSKMHNSTLPSEIQGEEGSIIIERISLTERILFVGRDGSEEDLSVPQHVNRMRYEVADFVKTINEGRTESSVNTFERSLQTIGIMDEARKQIGLVFPADKK